VPDDDERALWVATVAFGEDRRRRVASDVPQRAMQLVGGDTCVPFWRVRAKQQRVPCRADVAVGRPQRMSSLRPSLYADQRDQDGGEQVFEGAVRTAPTWCYFHLYFVVQSMRKLESVIKY